MILFEKFGQHQPLNRQAECYAREGIDISLSTLADQIGTGTVALEPIHSLIGAHVLAATRLHGDDTTVPLLARGGTRQTRLWTYVRDDQPFAGGAPPAALFFFSTDREKVHPNPHLNGWAGILQADAYDGYNDLHREDRKPGPVTSALCWSHARWKFFELADIAGNVRKGKPAHAISPVAFATVTRMDALFAIEHNLNGFDAEAMREVRQRLSRPLVEDLHRWLLGERSLMSRHNPAAKAIDYMFEKPGRWGQPDRGRFRNPTRWLRLIDRSTNPIPIPSCSAMSDYRQKHDLGDRMQVIGPVSQQPVIEVSVQLSRRSVNHISSKIGILNPRRS